MTPVTSVAGAARLETPVVPAVKRRPSVRIVLFSGGSGTKSICESLLRQPQIDLTILINAYDDGHSTGRIRRFIPGLLGPSDVRKNLHRMMPLEERCMRALRTFSNHRLPDGIDYAEAHGIVAAIAERRYRHLPPDVLGLFDELTVAQADTISSLFEQFYEYSAREAEAGRRFDYDDCALGNILFGACYLAEGRDFNRATAELSRLHEIRGTILNVTDGENLFLAARREDGSFLRGEADIVASTNSARISELLLIDGPTYLETIDKSEDLQAPELEEAIARGRRIPRINPDAAAVLASADVIVYGPGTQHSSLLPSYLTEGVAEVIAGNKSAEKIFISNIRRDADIPKEDSAEIVGKFLECMQRNGGADVSCSDVATRFFFQRRPTSLNVSGPEYIPFDPDGFKYPLDLVRVRDWEGQEGKHSGGRVLNELQQIIQARIDVALRPVRQLVSIVVPVLDEAPTVVQTLRLLTALDFNPLELSKEVIIVDGGSTDGTFELASAVPGVRVFRTNGKEGRGAALQLGIEHAHGEVVVFFPADLEYRTEDIFRVVLGVVRDEYKAVFGTRNVKCTSLSARLSQIYGSSKGLYLLSKYGGMLLSMATLLLYNRYVTDPLTCLIAFDADTLRSLNLAAKGLDVHTEIIAKLCRQDLFILEVPVDYKPRTRAQGKKTTPLDGARAMLPLIRGKFRVAAK